MRLRFSLIPPAFFDYFRCLVSPLISTVRHNYGCQKNVKNDYCYYIPNVTSFVNLQVRKNKRNRAVHKIWQNLIFLLMVSLTMIYQWKAPSFFNKTCNFHVKKNNNFNWLQEVIFPQFFACFECKYVLIALVYGKIKY